jgi:membrane-associated phospholipid phosphatase
MSILASALDLSFFPVAAAFSLVDAWRLGTPFVTVGIAMMIVVFALKAITRRPRPDGSSRDSFPSGHSAASAYVALCALPVAWIGGGPFSLYYYWTPFAALVAWAASIAWSRVRLGRHHATDAIVGTLIGAFASLAVAAVISVGLRHDDGGAGFSPSL